ncbi:MAG: ankyrin repeat domain-containing protein [Anaerolineales bacterium]
MDIFELVKSGERKDVLQAIADRPVLVYQRDKSGNRPVMMAIYSGMPELAAELRSRMDEINIWEAAALGELEMVEQFVTEDPKAKDAFALDGFTPLGLSSFFGQVIVVAWLLTHEADPNRPARNKMTVYPIHSAAAHRDKTASLTMVKLLVEHGAKVNVSQAGGWTPLHQAADHGNEELARYLLKKGADRTLTADDGRTPADMARGKGFLELADLLDIKVF